MLISKRLEEVGRESNVGSRIGSRALYLKRMLPCLSAKMELNMGIMDNENDDFHSSIVLAKFICNHWSRSPTFLKLPPETLSINNFLQQ